MDKTAVLDVTPHIDAEYEAALDRRLREMERREIQIADKLHQIERLQSETQAMLAELRERTRVVSKSERYMAKGAPPSDAGEANRLAQIAGSYADDPFWDEFVQLMEESRQAVDAVTAPAE